MAKSRVDIQLSQKHQQAIGRVCAEWANLEFAARWSIAELTKLDLNTALILTNSSNIQSWLDILGNLCRANPELTNKGERFVKIKKDILDLIGLRNDVVHGLWFVNPQLVNWKTSKLKKLRKDVPSYSWAFPKRGKTVVSHNVFTADEINKIAIKIGRQGANLSDLFLAPNKWPSTPA